MTPVGFALAGPACNQHNSVGRFDTWIPDCSRLRRSICYSGAEKKGARKGKSYEDLPHGFSFELLLAHRELGKRRATNE